MTANAFVLARSVVVVEVSVASVAEGREVVVFSS